jgi:cyanate permease
MTREASVTVDPKRWPVLAGVWFLYAAFGLIATSLAPLVPMVEADLGLSHAAMGSVMGAWQLVYIFSAVPSGILLDKLGARRALCIGALLIGASALGRSFADGYWGLLLAVMLFGMGGPIISAGAPKVITRWFKGSARGLAMGIYMTGPAIGGVVSLTGTHSVLLPVFDGNWRAVFQLWAGLAVVAALVWFWIATDDDSPAADVAGVAAMPRGDTLRLLLRQDAVRVVLLMSVGVFMINHGLNNWLPELLRQGGMSIVEAGYWAAIPTLIGILGSLVIPRLATPERRFRILTALCLCALLASLLLLSATPVPLTAGLLLQGVARSALMTVLVLTLVELPGIGDRLAGTASGLFFSAAEVGGVLGPLGLGLAYDVTGGFAFGLSSFACIAAGLALGARRLSRLVDAAGR